MTVAIASAVTVGNKNIFEVCPAWAKGCTCPTDGNGSLTTPHQTFAFPADPPTNYGVDPPVPDRRSPSEWAQACAQEALLLVPATVDDTQVSEVATMDHLTGLSLDRSGQLVDASVGPQDILELTA